MKKSIVAILGLLFFTTEAYSLDLFISASGSDTNSGTSESSPFLTLNKAQNYIKTPGVNDPEIHIKFLPGKYFCSNNDEWTFFRSGTKVFIESSRPVPSPAVSSKDDAGRPLFVGRNEDGSKCLLGQGTNGATRSGIWLVISHPKVEMNLTIQGLKFTNYRGVMTIAGNFTESTRVDQNISVYNNVFLRIGDLYVDTCTPGKGAIILNYTFGNKFTNNHFEQIRNKDLSCPDKDGVQVGTSGLVHAFYFTEMASRHLIEGNTFHGTSGSVIKLTNQSNQNTITKNRFSYVQQVLTDRWCGSRDLLGDKICKCLVDDDKDPTTECKITVGCPSWNNSYDSSNIATNVVTPKSVSIDAVLKETEYNVQCSVPNSKVRIRKSETDVIGPEGGSF